MCEVTLLDDEAAVLIALLLKFGDQLGSGKITNGDVSVDVNITKLVKKLYDAVES